MSVPVIGFLNSQWLEAGSILRGAATLVQCWGQPTGDAKEAAARIVGSVTPTPGYSLVLPRRVGLVPDSVLLPRCQVAASSPAAEHPLLPLESGTGAVGSVDVAKSQAD